MSKHKAHLMNFLIFLLPAACYLSIVFFPVCLRYLHSGYHSWDVGIYSQALNWISFNEINPFVTTRGTRIFFDHFDPILIPISFFAKFFHPAMTGIVAESFFVLATAFIFYHMALKAIISKTVALFAICYVLFSPATIVAVTFPFHPTTWAMLPIALLCLSITQKRFWASVGFLNFLFCFKEEFIFIGVMYTVWLSIEKKWFKSSIVGFSTLCWLFFVFFLRLKIADAPVTNFGGNLLLRFFENPFDWVELLLSKGNILFISSIPLSILCFYGLKKGGRIHVLPLFLAVPTISIRLLAGKWEHHYSAPLFVFLLFFVVLVLRDKKLPIYLTSLLIGLTVLISLEFMIKGIRVDIPFTRSLSKIELDERKEALDEAYEYLLKQDHETYIVAQGNLIPKLTEKFKNLFVLTNLKTTETYSKSFIEQKGIVKQVNYFDGGSLNYGYRLEKYEYLFLEKPPGGDNYGLGQKSIDSYMKAIEKLKSVELIFDNKYVMLVKGNFIVAP